MATIKTAEKRPTQAGPGRGQAMCQGVSGVGERCDRLADWRVSVDRPWTENRDRWCCYECLGGVASSLAAVWGECIVSAVVPPWLAS